MKAQEYFEAAKKKGYVEISSGVYLWSQEAIIEDQKEWNAEDNSKNMDFTTAPFWITTNSGESPEEIHSENWLLPFLSTDEIDKKIKELEESLTTQQQVSSLQPYKRHLIACEDEALPFWEFYDIWCSEEGVYNDQANYQR